MQSKLWPNDTSRDYLRLRYVSDRYPILHKVPDCNPEPHKTYQTLTCSKHENSFIRYPVILLNDERKQHNKSCDTVWIYSCDWLSLKNPVILLVAWQWYWTVISVSWDAGVLFVWWTFKHRDFIQIFMIHQLITLFSSVIKMPIILN